MWSFPYLVVGTLLGAVLGAVFEPVVKRYPGEGALWLLWWAFGGLAAGFVCDLCDPLKRPRPPRRRRRLR